RTQIHPSDDSQDVCRPIGEFKKPARLLQGLASLYGHGAMKFGTRKFGSKIFRQEIAAKRRHRFIDPGKLRRVIEPVMLVSVNVHGDQADSQFLGTFTYDRSSAATEGQPSSFSVRSRSVRKICSARLTPAS